MIISIDFGITITDTLRKTKDENLIHHMVPSGKKPDEKLIKNLFDDVNFSEELDLIALTGGHHKKIGSQIDNVPVFHINEVDAIGEGCVNLAGISKEKESIIVSAGTGTACIYAKEGNYLHCSGTGVGGGTVIGLSHLLIGTTDPKEIEELASKGFAKGADLLLEDVVSGPIGLLPPEITAVNFGRIAKYKNKASKEDLAAGIANLVGQTVARIATSVAMAFNASDIIVVGRTPSFSALKTSLEQAAALTNFIPHFPKNAEYASALGALLIAEKNLTEE